MKYPSSKEAATTIEMISSNKRFQCHLRNGTWIFVRDLRFPDISTVLEAHREPDGDFDTDVPAGASRYCRHRGPREVAAALRRMTFTEQQVRKIMATTKRYCKQR
jgi:hypothetical protein